MLEQICLDWFRADHAGKVARGGHFPSQLAPGACTHNTK